MRGSSIAFVVSCLVSTIHSFPFVLSDEGNDEDSLNSFLYSTPIDETMNDELASNSPTAGSGIELPLESYPTVLQDWSDPELDVSLQPSDTHTSDIIASSPGKILSNLIFAPYAHAKR